MRHRLRAALAVGSFALLFGAVVLLPGCAPRAASSGSSDGSTAEDSSSRPSGGAVIGRADLQRYGGRLIDAMESELTSLRVSYEPRASLCPLVSLRGSVITTTHSNPLVYVDDNRATNTCVLKELTVRDVERVEVHPSGSRSGYATHPSGLILVFTRGY